MKPKIRVKGFNDAWSSPTIENVFELRNGYTPSKAIKEFWEKGTIPWFRMEDLRENGGFLKDATQHITPLGVKGGGLFESGSIILSTTATIGEHAILTVNSLANQRFTNFKVCKSYADKYVSRFIYYAFFGIDKWAKKNTNSGGLLSVNMPLLVKQPFYTPSKEEQEYIALYFTHIDNMISTASSRLASLKQVKDASLQAMFPQKGETVPKIRFKGFEGEWEEVLLGSLFSERVENDITAEMLSVTMHDGIIKANENGRYDNSNSDRSNYKLVLKDDIAYNTMRMWQGASGCSPYSRGIVSPAYTVITPNVGVCSVFFAFYFKTNGLINKFRLNSQGLTKDTWNLKYPAFSSISILYPTNVLEQQRIASYFTSLDKQIALQTQRLEKLKQIKAACLDKMFV